MTFADGHALIVGIGGDLPNTVNDAEGLREVLIDPDRCAYPTDQVHLLTGPAADRGGILAALDTLAAATTTNSTVVIYFSGHGYRVDVPSGTDTGMSTSVGPRSEYYLFASGYDLSSLDATTVRDDEFSARLQAIAARKLLLLLDCCHAGGFDRAKAPGLAMMKTPLPPRTADVLAAGTGRVGIASSRADELSYTGTPYSAFTLALLEGLAGCGVAIKDGLVRVSDLALYAAQTVASRTHDKQHPALTFKQADDFAVAYYAGGDVTPKGLPGCGAWTIEPAPGDWANQGRTVVHRQIVTNTQVGFDQRGWKVRGNVIQGQGDIHIDMRQNTTERKPRRRKREG